MRVAVLGSGRMARFRATALLADPRVEGVALGSTSRERAEEAAHASGVGEWGSVEEVLAGDVDAVVIASATADHATQIDASLALRVPVLTEKPIAVSLPQSIDAVEAANRAGVELQVGFQRRFDMGYLTARDAIRSGDLGTLHAVHLISHDHEPPSAEFVATSGGLFRDLSVHDFDLARWLTDDEVDEVSTVAAVRSGLPYFAEHGDVDTAVTVLRMRSGLPVMVSSARRSPDGQDVRAEVFGSTGSAAVGVRPRGNVTFHDFLERFEQAFLAQTAAFVGMVADGAPNPCPGAEGVEALRIAVAAELSHRTGAPVRVSEVSA